MGALARMCALRSGVLELYYIISKPESGGRIYTFTLYIDTTVSDVCELCVLVHSLCDSCQLFYRLNGQDDTVCSVLSRVRMACVLFIVVNMSTTQF